MRFEADASKLKTEAEAIIDIRRKLNIVRASLEEIQDRLRIHDSEAASEICDRLRKQIERMDAVSGRLESLGKGLGKIASAYKAFDLSAAEMTAENRWIIPGADKTDPGELHMSSILNGIKETPQAVPSVIDTKNNVAMKDDPNKTVLRLSSERKEY